MKIGFIGLGIMGSRMAQNLLNNGVDLVIHNRSKDKATALLENGATWAETPAALAEQVDMLFTMLAHPEAVTQVALGDAGFLDALQAGAVWADCSTVNPAFSRQMAAEAHKREVKFLDSPVAGSKNQSEQGVLVFLVGGDENVIATCQPYFEHMGSRVVHVGGNGMGTSLKLVVNYLLGTTMAAFAEGLVLGEAMGVPREMLLNVIVGGPVAPPYLAGKRPKIEQGDYDPEFPLRLMQKDLQMADMAAYDVNAALPVGNAAKELYRLAIQDGLGDVDFSAIYSFLSEGVNATQ